VTTDEPPTIRILLVLTLVVVVVGVAYLQFWYITVPILIAILVLVAVTIDRKTKRDGARVRALRDEMKRVGAALVQERGREYAEVFADTLDLLADGEAPTFAGLQRRLDITRATAGSLIVECEELGLVTRGVHGARRTTAVDEETLRVSALGVRSALDA